MNIDGDAPVQVRAETTIDAPPEVVWDILAAVDRWSTWNPEVARAHLDGPLSPGASIRWKAGRAPITSTVATVVRPSELAWTGRTLGLHAVHVWRLEAHEGGTRIRSEESMRGLPALLARGRVTAMLERALQAWFTALEAEAGRRRAGM
jgi:uncharacterized protein YndB with AHSA1/START domain